MSRYSNMKRGKIQHRLCLFMADLIIACKRLNDFIFPFEMVESFLCSRTVNLVYVKFEKLYVKGKKSC